MENSIFAMLHKQLAEDKAALIASLTAGHCKDYAEYRELCGRIRGLGIAQEHIEDAAKRFEQDE